MKSIAWLLVLIGVVGLAYWQWSWRRRWRERQRAAEERRAKFIAEAIASTKRHKA